MVSESGISTGIGAGHRDWDLDGDRAPGCADRGAAPSTGRVMRSVRPPAPAVPAASAAPVEPEEGDESGGPSISISFVKNRGRLGALTGLDGWVAGSAQTLPFPSRCPRAAGTVPPGEEGGCCGRGAQGSSHGGSCTWGLHPRGAVWPPRHSPDWCPNCCTSRL